MSCPIPTTREEAARDAGDWWDAAHARHPDQTSTWTRDGYVEHVAGRPAMWRAIAENLPALEEG